MLRGLGGSKLFEVPILHTLISACYLRRDSDEALRASQEVAIISKEAKDPAAEALVQACVAQAHLANDEHSPAQRVAEAALGELRSAGDAAGELAVLGALCEISSAIGKVVSARKAAQELLERERTHGTKEGAARALLLAAATEEGKAAADLAAEAKGHYQDLGDKIGEGLASLFLAKAHLSQAKLNDALAAASDAFAAFQAAARPSGEALVRSLEALVHLRREDTTSAEKSSREALAMFQDAGHRVGQDFGGLLIRKSQQLAEKPSECKVVIDDHQVAHVEISGICTPKSLEQVLNALHQARCKTNGARAIVMLLEGSKGSSSSAGYTSTSAPQVQAVASGSFLLGLRTLGLPVVVACWGRVAGPAYGLLLAADYRIAANNSTFLLPIWGPPECLGDLVGHTVAMQLCYNQGPVSALTMLEYGVIHQCQKGIDDTKRAATEVARRISSTPTLACHQATTMLSPAIEKYATIVARGGVRA